MKMNRDVSFVEFQKALLKQMSGVLKPETFSYSTPLSSMFKIQLQEPSADPNTFLESKFEHPLMTEMIDLALSVHPSDSGPAHIKLSLEWNEPEKYFADMEDHFVEHESVSSEKKESTENSPLTLEQCLDHYTKEETLSAEDAWRCPNCREYLPVVKTLGLWSLPDILVIHFKRFRQQQLKGSHASKLTTMVNFPLNELDMLPWYLANSGQKSTSSTSTSLNGTLSRKANSSSMKPTSKSGTLTKSFLPEDHRFDLYAVCYHQGDTLETGHYTAACKNPYDQQWYKFDDQRVSLIKNEDIPDSIINNEAYMLFYQRRKESDNCDSSVASTSSSDHWVSKITANNTVIPSSSSSVTVPVIVPLIKKVESEEKDMQEVAIKAEPPKILPTEIIVEVEVEKTEIASILTDIADIKPIDSDDIPEVEDIPTIIAVKDDVVEPPIIEHSIKEEKVVVVEEEKAVILTNGFHSENYCNGIEAEDKKDDEKKMQVTVEISTCSPPPEVDFESEINDIVHKDILRREQNSKSQDFKVSHHNKINSLLWNDQNNNNNRHSAHQSDIGGITISELLMMDRIDDISSTSLPKNYMLHNHDTERITNRIRSVSSCSKDTLLFIDQQTLIDDDSLMDNRSHWVGFVA